MKGFFVGLCLALLACSANAQSVPRTQHGTPLGVPWYLHYVPTPAETLASYAAKADVVGGKLTAPAVAGGTFTAPTITGATETAPGVTGGVFTAPIINNGMLTTPTITGATETAPSVTGGVFTAPIINNGMLTTPTITGALLDGVRSNPTATQTIAGAQPGDNMALPSVNCTPVAQNVVASTLCYNMTAPVTTPALPPGNNFRSGGPGATTVNVGLENFNASNGVGIYSGVEEQPGGGMVWALNSVTNILPGAHGGGAGYEIDVNNISCDPSVAGIAGCAPVYGAWITGLTGFTNSVGVLITKGGGPGSNALWHYGVDVTSADTTAYQDTSNANVSYGDGGTHSVGLNLAGTYTGAVITLNGATVTDGLIHWGNIPTTSTPTAFTISPTITASNGVLGAQLNFIGNNGLQLDQAGSVITAGYLNARGNIGAQTTGFQTQGITLGWNLTSGGQESDILLGGGTTPGTLQVYSVSAAGTLTTAKGSPILSLTSTGVLKANSILSTGALQNGTAAVAGLPTCNSANEGVHLSVIDATAPTFLGALTGGGTVHAPAYCNGTAWVAG
jgi:hypothetical protein